MMPIPEILLVNDDPASLLALESVLTGPASKLEFKVVLAHSGEEALRHVLTHHFAVILLDVNMPGMDGFETAEAIHSHPRSAKVPIIFITAHYADEMYRLKGYQRGAVDYLFTPVIPQILLSKISVFVDLTKKNLELQKKTDELARLNQDLQVKTMQHLKRMNAKLEAEVIERKQAEERAKELAIRDPLTGLLNRRSLMEHVDHAISLAERHRRRFALLFLDLDKFKLVNDTLSHEVGDALLREVANRLTMAIRESDTAARLGGDEFVVVLEVLSSLDDISHVANKISKALEAEYHLDGHCINTSTSIGIATFPEDGKSVQTLIKNADLAMYHAKQLRRGSIQFFHEGLNAQQIEHRQLQQEFDVAFEKKDFLLHYQPRINVSTGKTAGIEVTLKWQHPRLGLSGIREIVGPTADRTQLLALNEWMMNRICAQAREWIDGGTLPEPLPITVNLVMAHLQKDLADSILSILHRYRLPHSYIQLYIPESLLLPDMENSRDILAKLREAGIAFGIEDFGVGYSSLTALKEFAPHFLKVHRSLISKLENQNNKGMLSGIVNIAHAMSLKVVMDGVENAQQLTTLNALGCDECQGVFLCEPVTAHALLHELEAMESVALD